MGGLTASMVRTRWQKLTSPLFDTADLYGHRGGRQWRMELDRGDTMSVEKWRRRDFATESGLLMRPTPPLTKISVSLRLFENEGRSGRQLVAPKTKARLHALAERRPPQEPGKPPRTRTKS